MRPIALTVLRGIALLILVIGAVAVATSGYPRDAHPGEFARDLDRGAVAKVVLDDDSGSWSSETRIAWVTWAVGPFQWRHGAIADGSTDPPLTVTEFHRLMDERGVRVETGDDDDVPFIGWPFGVPTWFGELIGLTWLAVFLAMLGSRPRLGNRWAWFWMFTVGQIGVLVYLLIEPTPLWRTAPSAPPQPAESVPPATADTRMQGGQGCLLSILASIGAGILAVAVGWAAGHLLP